MKINFETLMARANENYEKLTDGDHIQIHSRQVRALAQAVAEVLEIIQDEVAEFVDRRIDEKLFDERTGTSRWMR